MSSYAPAPSDGPVGGDPNEIGVFPLDEHNAKLLNLVAPRDYENPQADEGFVYDLVAIGAGASGLVSSKQSARRGWRSALVERHLAGGDCLNVGCVPSKALIRCARAAQAVREAAGFHVKVAGAAEAEVDFPAIMDAVCHSCAARRRACSEESSTISPSGRQLQARTYVVGGYSDNTRKHHLFESVEGLRV